MGWLENRAAIGATHLGVERLGGHPLGFRFRRLEYVITLGALDKLAAWRRVVDAKLGPTLGAGDFAHRQGPSTFGLEGRTLQAGTRLPQTTRRHTASVKTSSPHLK